jgi:hypothetical protein
VRFLRFLQPWEIFHEPLIFGSFRPYNLGQNASLFGSDGFRVFWEAYESIQHQARRRSSRFRRQARGAAVALASVDMANIQVEDILAGTPAVQCKTKVRLPFPSAPAAFAPRRK